MSYHDLQPPPPPTSDSVYIGGAFGGNTRGWFIPSTKHVLVCVCPEPDWDGMECRRCHRKPLAKMKHRG